jgi:hypothetical protein
MKKIIVLLIAVVGLTCAKAQPCLPEGITFETQEQIDNFQINYPGCTEIEGFVCIYGFDGEITNLNGLSILTSIGGSLIIAGCKMSNLTGLDNLTFIGGYFHIHSNDSLNSFTGLENLITIEGSLMIGANVSASYGNPVLTNLSGLTNLTNVEAIFITNNCALTNLTGLEGITSVGEGILISFNDALTSLSGLGSLTTNGEGLIIGGNDALTSLEGLNNLNSIGGSLSIGFQPPGLGGSAGNPSLVNLSALGNLTSIGGYLQIYQNPSLNSLMGLDNIDAGSIEYLSIFYNNLLSNCDVQSICDYLAAPNGTIEIEGNAPGCNSPEEVQAACDSITSVKEIKQRNKISILPNPAKDKITVSSSALKGNFQFSIFNVNGEKVMERQLTDNETQIDIYALPRGVYFVKLQNEKMVEVGKMVKE